MRPTAPLIVLALAAGPLAVHADAAPVAQARIMLTAFTLADLDGSTRRVRLSVTDASSPRLTLQVTDCDPTGCGSPDYYETRLPTSAVRIDRSIAAGELRTTLGRRPLRITWTPDSRMAAQGGTEGQSSETSETLSVYRAEPAVARISLGDAVCTTGGGVGDEIRLENPDGSAGTARPLVSLRPAATLTCD